MLGDVRLEMRAEFAEAGEDYEFAGAGHYWFVFHVPGVLVRDVDGVEADFEGGVDVAARAVADHPALRFYDFVFADEAGVGDGVFFVDDFDGLEKALQAGTLDFCRLLGRFAFREQNQAVALGEIGERFRNSIENFWRGALEVYDAVVNFGQRFPLGLMLGELHVGFFKGAPEAAHAVAILPDIFALGFVEDVANVGARETAGFDEGDEILDQFFEEDVVFPERIVGVNEKGIASHNRSCSFRSFLQGLKPHIFECATQGLKPLPPKARARYIVPLQNSVKTELLAYQLQSVRCDFRSGVRPP
jgi:hypothetical protein